MTQPPPKPKRWLLAVDPRVYHWDTLFVKGKEMWRHAGNRPDAARQLKQVQGRPRLVLPRKARALAVRSRGSDPRSLPRSARCGRKKIRNGPASHRTATTGSEARGNARESFAAKNQVPEEYAADHLSADRRRVRGNTANGRHCRLTRNPASLKHALA